MYWTTSSNTSGNVLKIVTDKNDAKFPEKYGNMYGNPWLPVVTRSMKAKEILKGQIDNSE